MENPVFENRVDLTELAASVNKIKEEVGKIIVGQHKMVDLLIASILADGHVLIEGVPGVAKTLTAKLIAKTISVKYSRIQFTPDLMPSDVLGTSVYNLKTSEFNFKKGPIFSNIVLIDEINRAPAKTQSALFEVMEERQITMDGTAYIMERPFMILATQNPVDQEGTYPLPEAQVDRFMMKIHLDYLSKEEELQVMKRMSDMSFNYQVKPILTKKDITYLKQIINNINISDSLERYIIELVFATRTPKDYGLTDEANYILYGASPRASIHLNLGAKAIAFLNGRDYVLPEDIKEIAQDVLNHRIILNYEAEADGVTTRKIIDSILRKVNITKAK